MWYAGVYNLALRGHVSFSQHENISLGEGASINQSGFSLYVCSETIIANQNRCLLVPVFQFVKSLGHSVTADQKHAVSWDEIAV